MSAGWRRALRAQLTQALADHVTPGAVVEVGTTDGVVAVEAAGRLTYAADAPEVDADTVYDLASLTKAVATATLAMRHLATGALSLDTPVVRRVPAFTGAGRDAITVADLLEHCAGLPAHRPYYRRIAGRDAFAAAIAAEPLAYPPRTRHEYTDLGFMLLGLVLEDVGRASLAAQFDAWRDDALGNAVIGFGYRPAPDCVVAPTEVDPWRGRVLTGVVHDGNAAALGGVAGHAGLFGTAAAVGAFARWFLALWLGRVEASAGVPAAVAARFAARGRAPGSSRALGWDTMLPTSSCGTRFSPRSIGHTGHTGTSLWIDPERRLYVVLLTNRVHPRGGDAAAMRALRIGVHDAVAGGSPR